MNNSFITWIHNYILFVIIKRYRKMTYLESELHLQTTRTLSCHSKVFWCFWIQPKIPLRSFWSKLLPRWCRSNLHYILAQIDLPTWISEINKVFLRYFIEKKKPVMEFDSKFSAISAEVLARYWICMFYDNAIVAWKWLIVFTLFRGSIISFF